MKTIDSDPVLLRQNIGALFGFDIKVLESIWTQECPEKKDERLKKTLSYEWNKFKHGWNLHIIHSAKYLVRYLDEPIIENMRGARTFQDNRFQKLGPVIEGLRCVSGYIEKNLPEIDSELGNSSLKVGEKEYLGKKNKLFQISKQSIQIVLPLLEYYHQLRLNVDAFAFIDGFLAKQGTLVYGENHFILEQINRIKPVSIFGMNFTVRRGTVWFLLFTNVLVLLILMRLLQIGWSETFSKKMMEGEAWFVLAFPVLVRKLLLVWFPSFGFLIILALVGRFLLI
ncbi:MAG: hypothetical protein JSV88_06825 [Candidatus Aminicenantes bacterium]|nr:MAG: hypothetical protein JSV88_06825 [Candidatus Aminicenantes bacterium]